MKKLNPFKPFIVLALVAMYMSLLLGSLAAVGLMFHLPNMPLEKAVIALLFEFLWFGSVLSIISCHSIVRANRKAKELYDGI